MVEISWDKKVRVQGLVRSNHDLKKVNAAVVHGHRHHQTYICGLYRCHTLELVRTMMYVYGEDSV